MTEEVPETFSASPGAIDSVVMFSIVNPALRVKLALTVGISTFSLPGELVAVKGGALGEIGPPPWGVTRLWNDTVSPAVAGSGGVDRIAVDVERASP